MNIKSLLEIANAFDSLGEYNEADLVFESMMRLAAGPDGRGKTQGRPRPRNLSPQLTPEQVRARLRPNAPQGLVPANQAPVAPQRFKFQNGLDQPITKSPITPPISTPNAAPSNPNFAKTLLSKLLEKKFSIEQIEEVLNKAPANKSEVIAEYNRQFGENAYQNALNSSSAPGNTNGQQSRGQSQSRPGSGANQANNAGRGPSSQGPSPSSQSGTKPGGNAGPGANPGGGSTSPGGAANAKPGGGSSYRGSNPFDPIPKDFNAAKAAEDAAKYRKLILENPGSRPGVAAKLELLVKKGLLDPKTGRWLKNFDDLQISELERFYKKISNTADALSDASKAGKAGNAASTGFDSAKFVKILTTTKAGQKLGATLQEASSIFTKIISKVPAPVMKVLSKVKIVFILLNFYKFYSALMNGTLEYKQTIEFIAACAAISPPVMAALGALPIVGPGLVIAVTAVNLGAADVVQWLGDPESGLNYMGFQITGESARRKTDKIDFTAGDISQLDPSVQNALQESIPLIVQGQKISQILTNPSMVQKHPWLSKRDDIRFTQFSGAMGAGGFYKKYKLGKPTANQTQQVNGAEENIGSAGIYQPGQPGQPGQRREQQTPQQAAQTPQQPLRNYNDLLYKAYVDTVQNKNVTLDNLINYKDQIIQKINTLAQQYPNINAQQSIALLENRIRQYSAQQKPA